MLCEYFPPFDSGGSEWSTFYLAKGLKSYGWDITILTPNYGNAPKHEASDSFEIYRFPFYKKLKGEKTLTPFWHTNAIWLIWSSICTLYYTFQTKAEIVHVQGKYFLPAAIITKVLTGKKIVFTARDYILLCPLGMCLIKGSKACNYKDFIRSDFAIYIKNYFPFASKIHIFLLFLFAIRARLINYILIFTLKFVDKKVAVSKVANDVYSNSGVGNMEVIANPFVFETHTKTDKAKNPVVIFAGRLTYGKGIKVFLESIPAILKVYPSASFLVAGEGFLVRELKQICRKTKLENKIQFLGFISHDRLLTYLSKSTCTVMPSVWPEPFGRIALESIGVGTPVVVSSRAGISETILNKVWGKIENPIPASISQGVVYVIKYNSIFRENIAKDIKKIRKIWSENVFKSYDRIYNGLLK